MAKKPKQDKTTDAKTWLQKIDRAKEVRKKWHDKFRIGLCYEYWEGIQRPANIPEQEWITINMIYSNLQALLPTLYNTDPYFYVKLKRSFKPDPTSIALYEKKGAVRQSMLNYLKTELFLKTKTHLSIFDAMFQFGILKTHYYSDMEDNPEAGKPMVDEYDLALYDDEDDLILEPETIPTNSAYKITRIHPNDFLADEDAGPLSDDWNWLAHRIKKPLEDVQENKKFNETVRMAVKATEIAGDNDEIQKEREYRKKGGIVSGEESTQEPEVVVYWELYDLRNKQMMVMAEGYNEDFLLSPEDIPKGIEDHPFSILRFTLRDDSFYPLPPVSQWIDPQREYCTARSKIQTHRKRFNRKYEVFMGGLEDESETSKLESGEDGTFIKTNTPGGGVVSPIKDAPLDQNHIQEIALIRKDFEDLAVGPNQRGSATGVDSATEAGILEKRLQVKEGNWIATVIDFVVSVAKKTDQLVQVHITEDQAVSVSGPQGEIWEIIRMADYEDIEGEYEYTVNMGAMVPRLPEIERAQWTAFLQLLSGAPWLALSEHLLKEMAKLYHIESDQMIQELMQIAQKLMSGQLQQPKPPGSTAGVSEQKPAAMQGGMAAGINNIRGGAA